MADEYEPAPKRWSLEEIDELLRDSGMYFDDGITEEEPAEIPKKAESVDPRPTYDESVEHKIITKKVEKSEVSRSTRVFGSLESSKYRERFLNRPQQNLEKTAEHNIFTDPPMYERSGFIKKESSFKNTNELEPVPIIVSDDILVSENENPEATKTIGLRALAVTNGDSHETEIEEEDDSQLTFEGFNTEEDELPKVSEAEVEEELIIKRREKAAGFVISKEITEEENDDTEKFGIDEYRTVNDKFKVGYYLKKKKTKSALSMTVNIIGTVLSVVLSVFCASSETLTFPVLVLNTVLISVCCIFSYDIFGDGIKSCFKLKFNRNSGAAISVLFSLIYGASLFLCSDTAGDYRLFTAASLLPLLLNSVADYIDYKRIKDNFSELTENEYYSVECIDKKEAAFEIGRGLLLDEPKIIYSRKTEFPARFLELSRKYYPSDETNKKSVPVVFFVSLAVSVITYFVSKDIFFALGAFCASLSVGVPYFSFITDALGISDASKELLGEGGIISGWEAYRECAESNAVTVDATDIFDKEGGNIFGIKTFSSMKVDDAILNTAALLVSSGGPLGELFKRVILGKTDLLPPVESLAYEDKLGLSAWVGNRRVLVGNSNLLHNHNVEVPDKSFTDKFLHDGRYPLFLAIEGKLAAMFIVSYDVNYENAKYIRNIERNGLSLLIKADDANITDDMVSSNLNVHSGGIKVLSAVSSDILSSVKKQVSSAADALLLHNGKSETYIKCVSTALSLGKKKHISSLLQICASGVGIAFVAALGFVSGMSSLLCTQLCLTQFVFTGIALSVTKFKK